MKSPTELCYGNKHTARPFTPLLSWVVTIEGPKEDPVLSEHWRPSIKDLMLGAWFLQELIKKRRRDHLHWRFAQADGEGNFEKSC